MTIEQKIKKILKENHNITVNIANLVWRNMPTRYCEKVIDGVITTGRIPSPIIELVKKADLTECLTSNCEYIRECKKWYMEKRKETL